LYYAVRTLASQADAPVPDELAEAVAQVREIETFLVKASSWSVVDGAFVAVEFPGQFSLALSERLLPPRDHLAPDIKRIRVANAASRLAAHLDALAPKWLAQEWPARKVELEKRAEALSEFFPVDMQAPLMTELDRRLGIRSLDRKVSVRLVAQMPGEASTSLIEPSGIVGCVLAVQELSLPTLGELALYEVMQSLNSQPFYPASMPKTMLKKLSAAKIEIELGLATRNKMMRLCAADLMRQFVDAKHVDAGLETGNYARRPKLHALESDLWAEYWHGGILRPQLVDALCATLSVDWDEKRP